MLKLQPLLPMCEYASWRVLGCSAGTVDNRVCSRATRQLEMAPSTQVHGVACAVLARRPSPEQSIHLTCLQVLLHLRQADNGDKARGRRQALLPSVPRPHPQRAGGHLRQGFETRFRVLREHCSMLEDVSARV